MVFAHDTEVALAAAVALINTAGSDREKLQDIPALDAFFRAYGWTGRHEHSEAELRSVRELRPHLRRIWQHDEEPYHLHATSPEAPLATRMAVEAAMAFVDVVRSGELSRLRICEYPGCGNVIVDLSKNRSKRFCDAGCGNRAAVTAYR